MDYELKLHESPGEGIRRILIECVDHVYGLMTDPQPTREEAVHEARKTFKQIRAALRLVRDETGPDWYRRENIFYRDASRLLAPVRDSAVLVLSLDATAEAYADIVDPQFFASIRQRLVQRHEDIVEELLDEQDAMQIVADRMGEGLERLQEMPVSSEAFSIYAEGLRRVYKKGRQAMAQANADPENPLKFHEWRKRVKYLWHHTDILQQVWPLMLQDTGNELHLLSDFLGDAHDLVVLKETLLAEPPLSAGELNLITLLALLDRRRRYLEEASWTLGQRLYAERPKDFARRIAAYWEAWQQDPPQTREALLNSVRVQECQEEGAEAKMTLDEIIPPGIFIGTSMILRKDGRFLYGIRPVRENDGQQILELTGIGGGLEAYDQSYTAGAVREALEEIGCEVNLFPCPTTLIVRGQGDIEKVTVRGDEQPAAVVFRKHRTPPHQPWHLENQGEGCLLVFMAEIIGRPSPSPELPYLIWVKPEQILETGRGDVPLSKLLTDGAVMTGEALEMPADQYTVRLTDSQEAIVLALGPDALSFFQATC
ncbi:MAG: CHAD domain-containing protein [Candidatus Promineifilaceae bacterium]|jgi:CHAD domain-containing protein/8-oxo-dGTP pyrophosphatase MutT (NUDIX family)